MPLLSGCGDARPSVVKPPVERTQAVAFPTIPAGKVPCKHDPSKLCLDDEQTGTLLGDLGAALDAANDKLQWLRDWFKALPD